MLLTLTTDFGQRDAYVGSMKGVILALAPDAVIVDLSHEVPPQDVVAGALLLAATAPCFPPGTIHVGVVDPGVGTERAALAVRTARAIFVGPDNGLFTLALEADPPVEIVHLTNPQYHRQPVSDTFHGRDIFAPVAGHLARGVALADLGEPAADLVRLDLPQPAIEKDGLHIHVLAVDHFGNLMTNLTRPQYQAWRGKKADEDVTIYFARRRIRGISRTYADVAVGHLVAYFGSTDRLEIGLRNGSAARSLRVRPGATMLLQG